MRRSFIYLFMAVLFFLSLIPAQAQQPEETEPETSSSSFRIEAIGKYGLGSTIYELNAMTPDPRGSGEVVPIRSGLEFPLDVVMAGGRITWKGSGGSLERWEISVEILTNLNDPSSRTINSDFLNGREVVHTESNAQLDLIAGHGVVMYRLAKWRNTDFSLLLRTDYQRIEQSMVGYTGWQKSLFSDVTFDISGTAPVLDYRVIYICPQFGGRMVQRIGTDLALQIDATAGVVFASDFDNHILRERTSEGSGTGFGMNVAAVVELLPGTLPVRGFSVALHGGVTYYQAEGGMDQTFSNGNHYLDIPYQFESLQYFIGISAGLNINLSGQDKS